MYVACSTLCFARQSFDEALATIREMRFAKIDLAIHTDGPHMTVAEVLADIMKMAQRLKSENLPIAAFHIDVGHADGPNERQQLRGLSRLARLATVPVLTVPAAPLGSDFDQDVERLAEWSRIAESEGVILTVETHGTTLTADPAAAVELCRRIPGLGITLDPSHYHVGPDAPKNYDPLYPYVRHVRLRDSGTTPDAFQVRIGQGDMEYGRILSQLSRYGYDRTLTVDVRDVADSPFPVAPEVRKLKYLLESLV